MDYTILKLENGDFVKIAERETKEKAEKFATWTAAQSDKGDVFEVRKGERIELIIRNTGNA